MKQFYSDRLVFREVNFQDRQNLEGLFRDWGLAAQDVSIPVAPAMIDLFIAQAINDQNRNVGYAFNRDEAFAVSLINEAQLPLIGYIQVRKDPADRDPATTDLGYWIAQPYRNQGYITEGIKRVLLYFFENTTYQKVNAFIDPANMASQRVLEKTGFQDFGYVPAPPASHIKSAQAKLWQLDRDVFTL